MNTIVYYSYKSDTSDTYKYHKPYLFFGVMVTNLAIVWGP